MPAIGRAGAKYREAFAGAAPVPVTHRARARNDTCA